MMRNFHQIVGALFGRMRFGLFEVREVARHAVVMITLLKNLGVIQGARHALIMCKPGFIGSVKASRHLVISSSVSNVGSSELTKHAMIHETFSSEEIVMSQGANVFDVDVTITPQRPWDTAVDDVEYKIGIGGSWVSTGLTALPGSFTMPSALGAVVRFRKIKDGVYGPESERMGFSPVEGLSWEHIENADYRVETEEIEFDPAHAHLVMLSLRRSGAAPFSRVSIGDAGRLAGEGTELLNVTQNVGAVSTNQMDVVVIVPAGESGLKTILFEAIYDNISDVVVGVYRLREGLDDMCFITSDFAHSYRQRTTPTFVSFYEETVTEKVALIFKTMIAGSYHVYPDYLNFSDREWMEENQDDENGNFSRMLQTYPLTYVGGAAGAEVIFTASDSGGNFVVQNHTVIVMREGA